MNRRQKKQVDLLFYAYTAVVVALSYHLCLVLLAGLSGFIYLTTFGNLKVPMGGKVDLFFV